MNKFLPVLALVAALATGCGGTLVSNEANLTSQYTVNNIQFNGQSYSGPVICDDRTTALSFSFDYLGATPHSVTAQLIGSKGGVQAPQVTGFDDSGNTLVIHFVAAAGTVPLSVSQGIVVSPKVSGATKVRFTVNLAQGVPPVTRETQYVPVLQTCSF